MIRATATGFISMLFAAAAAAVVAGVAFAQDGPVASPEAVAATPVAPPPADVIRTSEVAGRAAATEKELREIRAVAGQVSAVEAIVSELADERERLEAAATESVANIATATRIQRLDDIERRWQRDRSKLDGWNDTLTTRARLMETQGERLDQLQDLWERTRQEVRGTDVPTLVVERIQLELDRIDETRQAVSLRSTEVLEIQAEVAALVTTAGSVLTQVAEMRSDLRGRLLGSDTVPLWTAIAQGPVADESLDRVFAALQQDLLHTRDYAWQRLGKIQIHLGCTVLVALSLLSLRRRAHAQPEPESDADDASALVLSRPFSSAILIGYAAAPLIYTSAPSLFYGLLGFVVLIPILRVIPLLLERIARPTFYVMVSFFVIDRFRELLAPLHVVERSLFAAEVAVAIVVFALLLRPGRLALVSGHSRFLPIAGVLLRLGILVLFASLVANLIGSTVLGELLGEATLVSAYAAVAVFAVYRVVFSISLVLLRSPAASRLNMVRRHRPFLERRWTALLRAVALFAWATRVFEEFTLHDDLFAWTVVVLSAHLSIGELSISLGDILSFFVVFGVALLFSRALRMVLEEDVLPRMHLPRGVPYAVTATIHYSILFVGALAALAATGIDMGRISILAGALSVGVGFGLQNVVNNFVSGLILLFERPVQTGDVVEAGALLGEVRRIGIRASTLRTLDGAEVIVPNANLISEQVVNWTLSDRQRRVEVSVGVKYGTDPERVLALLLRIAHDHDRILDVPEPDALFLGFGESSLDFKLRAWTGDFARWKIVHSELNVAVNRALAEAGIEIPFPQRDLHLRSVAPGVGRAIRDSEDGD